MSSWTKKKLKKAEIKIKPLIPINKTNLNISLSPIIINDMDEAMIKKIFDEINLDEVSKIIKSMSLYYVGKSVFNKTERDIYMLYSIKTVNDETFLIANDLNSKLLGGLPLLVNEKDYEKYKNLFKNKLMQQGLLFYKSSGESRGLNLKNIVFPFSYIAGGSFIKPYELLNKTKGSLEKSKAKKHDALVLHNPSKLVKLLDIDVLKYGRFGSLLNTAVSYLMFTRSKKVSSLYETEDTNKYINLYSIHPNRNLLIEKHPFRPYGSAKIKFIISSKKKKLSKKKNNSRSTI